VEDARIVEAGERRFAEAGEVGWLRPEADASATGLAGKKAGLSGKEER
jgi:hypothetical protein